jgi:protein SCO1
MKPSSSNPEKQNSVEANSNPAVPDESTSLTRRELFSTICLGLAIAGVAAGIAIFTGSREKAALVPGHLDHPRQLVAFNLTDRSGRSVTQADVAGKILIVNFVFTSCSLSCRAVNDRMEEIQRLVADMSDVQLVSLTVDPRTDTPSVLAKFANSFHADTNRWLFLTGNKPELYDLIETSFIPKSPELEDLIPGGFTSTDRIMLVDQKGNVSASFNGLKHGVASTIVAEIERLRKSTNPK